jgi:hypothetical protein
VFRLLMVRLADPTVTPDQRARIAGEPAGGAFAQLGSDTDYVELGRQLLAAGLLIQSGVIDYGRLAETVREAGRGRS